MSEITKVREALLAQHFEDIDALSDKIVGAADRIERATAALNGTPRAVSPKPVATPVHATPGPQASWSKRALWVVAVLACVAVSAGVGAIVARSMSMQTPDQTQASAIGRGLVQAWPNIDQDTKQKLWKALDPETREAYSSALAQKKN